MGYFIITLSGNTVNKIAYKNAHRIIFSKIVNVFLIIYLVSTTMVPTNYFLRTLKRTSTCAFFYEKIEILL